MGLRSRLADIIRGKASLGELRKAETAFDFIEHGADWAPKKYGTYYATNVPAYRAVQVRSDAIASARLLIGAESINAESGRKEFLPVEDTHTAQELLDRVNPWYTRGDMWRQTEAYLLLYGAAYWFIAPASNGQQSIWGLHPDSMNVIPGRGGGPEAWIDHFEYHIGGRILKLPVDQVLWFRRFNPMEEFAGLSHIAPVRLGLDMGHEALLYNRQFFKNGVQLNSVAFAIPGMIAPEEVEAFYKRLDDRFVGAKNAHRPILVPGGNGAAGPGVSVQNLGFSQKDMEFVSSLNWTVADAARAFGVPPPMLYAETQSKYANVHEWNGDFYRTTIMPEWDYLASTIQERLLPILGFPDLSCRFDFTDNLAIQESMTLLRDADRNDVSAGIMTVNEVRESRGLPAVPWGDAPNNPFMSDPSSGGPLPLDDNDEPKPKEKSYRKFGPRIDREYLSKAYSLKLRGFEREFDRLQQRLFTEQQRAITTLVAEGVPPSAVFVEAHWIERWAKTAMPLYETVMKASGEEVARRFGLFRNEKQVGNNPPAFSLAHPEVQKWLKRRVELWSTLVNEETGKLINQEINEANLAGESIPEIQARLEKVFRFNDKVRTERIARTEMLSTSNQGHLAAYEQSGVVNRIQWLATKDSRTRDTHAAADGQTVELGQPFKVGNASLDAPGVGEGGTLAPPEEVINCRCVTIPVLDRRSVDYRTAAYLA